MKNILVFRIFRTFALSGISLSKRICILSIIKMSLDKLSLIPIIIDIQN